MIRRNSGSRCPSSGRLSALVASGYGLDGPGPKRWRSWITERRYLSETRARVEDALRVQGVLDPPGQRHHVGAELVGQRAALGAPHAVLAGDGAAERDRRLHDVAEGQAGPPFGLGVGGVV